MKERLKQQYPWLIVALVLLCLLVLNLFWQDHWLDSDMAAEMMFSKLLAEEGHLFGSGNWYYSSEFRVLYTQLLMVPLFHLTGNWHVIRLITNMVTYVLLLASYFYLAKTLRVDRNVKILCSVALLLPFSETMMLHMQIGNTYMPHLILLFFYYGIYVRLTGLGVPRAEGIRRIVLYVLFTALAIVFGLSGVRYLLAMQIPLLLTTIIRMIRSDELRRVRLEGAKPGMILRNQNGCRMIGIAFLGCIASGIGYLINILVIAKAYSFATYESISFIAVYQGILVQRLQDTFGSLLMLFGYIPEKAVLSVRGLISMVAFVLMIALFLVWRKVRHTTEEQHQFLLLFFEVSFVLNTFVFVFTDSTVVPRYFLTSLCFLVPLAAVMMSEEKVRFDRNVLALVLIAALALATLKTAGSMAVTDKNAGRRASAQYLVENGYTFGYATYWNANILQEMTDGSVEVANILDPESMEFFRWSSEARYYEPDYADGKVFLLLTCEEEETYQNARALQRGERVYADADYVIYSYDSAIDLLGETKGNG